MSFKPSPAQVLPARLPEARWRPGLNVPPFHSEIFASSAEGSGAGLALALARDALAGAAENHTRHVLWVQDRKAIRLNGRPFLHGLPPDLRHRVIHVAAATP
ncbi:MAG: recA-like protein, partial [Sphingomonadales bacterium]|nr:recA-like protein [Sphingomonadales bacterium]